MAFKVNIFRTWINSTFLNLCRHRYHYVRQISSSASGKGIPVKCEITEFPQLVNNEEDKEKITHVITEYETLKSVGRRVPSDLSCDQVDELLTLPTKSQRVKYLTFLHKKEMLKISRARKKVREVENRKNRAYAETGHIRYGTGFNTLLPFIYKAYMKKLLKRRAVSSIFFGQEIVIDLAYDDYMVKWEAKNCAYQLCEINRANMGHTDPFNIYLCNADRSKATMHYLEKSIPDIWDDILVTCTSSSYLDIFPKEKLVYLSPHSEEIMEHYDHGAIYIIGGFVDKRIHSPISYEKAKRDGIRSCRLPLDEHVQYPLPYHGSPQYYGSYPPHAVSMERWKCGTKSLTLDQMVNILLEMKVSNDWKKAFKFLPSRKISQTDEKND